MRWSLHPLFFVVALLSFGNVAEAKDKVVLYGATWCPPCRAVKAFLQQSGVRFVYQDIDSPSGRTAYNEARGSYRGIPLTTVGRTKIKGANLKRLQSALHLSGNVKKKVDFGTNTYGGHRAQWWQTQFQELRRFKKQLGEMVAQKKRVAADNVELEQLAKLQELQKEVNGALQQLNNDASNQALPRKFRR